MYYVQICQVNLICRINFAKLVSMYNIKMFKTAKEILTYWKVYNSELLGKLK